MNSDLLSAAWSQYKTYFRLPADKNSEKYKWNVIQQVKEKWDWSRTDKAEMFKNAFLITGQNNNLWTSMNYYPVGMANRFFEEFPVETVEAFNILFNEDLDLLDRINRFKAYFDEKLAVLRERYTDQKLNYHSQDLRSISLYLFLQNPQKYYLYKFTAVKSFSQRFGFQPLIKGTNEAYITYLDTARQITEFIQNDQSFLSEYKSFVNNPDIFDDNALHLLTQDFIYTTMAHLTETDPQRFKAVHDELVELMNTEVSPIKHLSTDKLTNTYFFILDGDQINSIQIHYEVYRTKQKLTLNVHFEYKNKASNDYFHQAIKTLPSNCSWFPWYKSKSIRYNTAYDLRSENVADQLFDGIVDFVTSISPVLYQALQIKENHPLPTMETTQQDVPNFPLNQILYGPPGTGKTYNTINRAIQILSPSFDLGQDRSLIKQEYQRMIEEGRIVFTTFHQSMSYEDFIEGIKPQIHENDNDDKTVIYEVKDGIFKEIAKKALKPNIGESEELKEYTFDEAWNELIEESNKNLESDDPLFLSILTPKLGLKVVGVSSAGNLRLKPVYSDDAKEYIVSYDRAKKLQASFPELSVVKNIDKEFRAVIGGSNSTAYWSVLNFINTKIRENPSFSTPVTLAPKPYVLIIDEINRGNVSQIFGELITLLEEDKRMNNAEALETTLPYSKEKFGVPNNLYIIGTMNTADRSVESLDTALRRRFSFVEMKSDPEVLNLSDFEEVDLVQMLSVINERIEILLDKDHQIGHAYFVGVRTLSDLQRVFKDKIIPLLEEYFYGDFGKIGLVLGDRFIVRKKNLLNAAKVFANFSDYDEADLLLDKAIYVYKKDISEMTAEEFVSIYDPQGQQLSDGN